MKLCWFSTRCWLWYVVVNNAKQFDCHILKDFYHQMGVGVVEKANTLIFMAIEKILEDKPQGKWADEFL
jgi:hypothetical protein